MSEINWPLMKNNITKEDINVLIEYLETYPNLAHGGEQVRLFEEEWSAWLGVKYSVFVNSGASANLITISTLKHRFGFGNEIIVPPLTWVSDIASVLQNGYTPVFIDINQHNFGMDISKILRTVRVRQGSIEAVFLTHVQGFNALSYPLINGLDEFEVPLIEDVCESHGATYCNKRLGSFGLMSNFSFYYAHHMSTVEGGMVCTDSEELYQILRMFRSHGMVREATNDEVKVTYTNIYPDLHPNFIFAYPAYNVRNTEIGAVLGRSQLRRLDENNFKRKRNLLLFLSNLDSDKYRTSYDTDGSCNYAFPLVIKEPDLEFRSRLERAMYESNIEFRRGSSGGGNQLRQPYLRKLELGNPLDFPETEHIHHYGYYVGNYPELEESRIIELCQFLNQIQ